MTVLKDIITRDQSKPLKDAHVDPGVQVGVKNAIWDEAGKTLTVSGNRPDPGPNFGTAFTDTINLDHVPGGNSYGEKVSLSNNIAPVGTRGAAAPITHNIEASFATNITQVGNSLRIPIFDASGNPITIFGKDVVGLIVVPVRGDVELFSAAINMTFGQDAETSIANGDYESHKVLRFDNDRAALIVH